MPDSSGKPERRPSATAERILDIAQRIIQDRGYSAMSYADIAAEMGIAKASLHHHFPTKASLGRAVIERHLERSHTALAEILGSTSDPVEQLRRFAEIYQSVLDQKLGCLCGMMTAEFSLLPPVVQEVVRQFFDFNEQWLEGVITRGRAAGKLRRTPSGDGAVARGFLSALQGALMLGRSQDDAKMLAETSASMIQQLAASG